ncbi:MAG: DUF6062 family protein [Firmicutes bacterium]|nr:DUF6062 family protein [Bacillota bacterium]MCL2255940.1 DUF6062 family protein [Bacillota bacterium]
MKYHIQTTPIWDAFKARDGCPICEIYRVSSDRLVSQYLNEAVMESDYRIRVNKYGFCKHHIEKLYCGENKLGLALQLSTRTDFMLENLKLTTSSKGAKKEAQKLKTLTSTCVICLEVDEMMERYAKTISQMFLNEIEFQTELKQSTGFCFKHYVSLLEHTSHSGKSETEYLNILDDVMRNNLTKANNMVKRFCNSFDHKSIERGDPNAVKKMVEKYL